MIVVSLVLSILFSIFSCILRFFADVRLRQDAVAGFFIKNSCAHRAIRIGLFFSATIVPQERSCGQVKIAELRGFPRRPGWERPPFPGANIERFPALMRDWRMQVDAAREKGCRHYGGREPPGWYSERSRQEPFSRSLPFRVARSPVPHFPVAIHLPCILLSAIDRVCPFPGGSCCFCG